MSLHERDRALSIAGGSEPGFTPDDARDLLATKIAPWVRELGLEVESCTPERALLRMPGSPGLARHGDTVCGQALMAAADTAIAIGISAAFGRFQNITTVSQTMNFMRAIPAGDVAIEVSVKKLGRSLVFAEASFRAAGSRAIAAQALATWAVIP
jgi:uncharacterized protein (TIGR00369 family)